MNRKLILFYIISINTLFIFSLYCYQADKIICGYRGEEVDIENSNLVINKNDWRPIEESLDPLISIKPIQNLESVILPDDRSRITPTTLFPWSAICKLYITAADDTQWIGSGALVSDYHILTAGHCVYIHDHGGWASSIEVIPGMDNGNEPYGHAFSTNLQSYSGWTDNELSEYDIALITLDDDIGSSTGYMLLETASYTSSIYTGTLNTAGYPGDLDGGLNMYYDSDYGSYATEYFHYYWMDTAGGQSGSPVWRITTGDNYNILSVHTTGSGGSSENIGTRLNLQKYDDINSWIDSYYLESIMVSLPSSSSSWEAGTGHTIMWSSTGSISNVKIELYKSSIYVSTIVSSTPNDGSYDWNIPSSTTPGSDYKIKIIDASHTWFYDYSSEFDIIESRTITISSPSSSSSWEAGTGHTIMWSSTGSISSVKIELYKSSTYVSTIVSSTPNDGSYNWNIPSSTGEGTDYTIKIIDTSESNIYDYSDQFEIMEPRTITVSSPSSSSSWDAGIGHTISWSSTGSISSMKIELYKSSTYVSTIVSSTFNDGSYDWNIPSSTGAGTDYTIKIIDTSDSNIYDYSDQFQIIGFKSITVSLPSSSSSWEAGTSHTISWSSTGSISSVKIELYKNYIYISTIVSSTLNDGSYNWNIPSSTVAGTDYIISIVDTSDSNIYDYSNQFEIKESSYSPPTNDTVTSSSKSITLINPPVSSLEAGSKYTIKWSSTGSISDVKIELYKSSTLSKTIVATTANDESFDWTIPSDTAEGTNYVIKISSTSDSSVYDYSKYFEIKKQAIPGYDLFIIFVLISFVSLGLIFLLKKRWRIFN